MVNVTVSKNHRVRDADLLTQELHSNVGRGVDQECAIRSVDSNASPHSFVARIRRLTDVAITTDHRHASARSRSQKNEFLTPRAGITQSFFWT